MISLSPKAKEVYSKYIGPDGKLIIDDSVPENLRETFKYFNDNDINILELNVERNYTTLDEDLEPEMDDDDDMSEENEEIDILDEDDESDVEDELDDFF